MKIFLCVSYSAEIGPDGRVNPEYRANLEAVIAPLEAAGHTVFCAPRADGWQINDLHPHEAIQLDKKMIAENDVLVAFVAPNSAGQQYEVGLADALGKRIVLAHQSSVKLPYIAQGLLGEPHVSELVYQDIKTSGQLILKQLY